MSYTGLVTFQQDGFDCGNGYHRESKKDGKAIYCGECGYLCSIDSVNSAWEWFCEDVEKQCKAHFTNADEVDKAIRGFLSKTIECTLTQFQGTIDYDRQTNKWK